MYWKEVLLRRNNDTAVAVYIYKQSNKWRYR